MSRGNVLSSRGTPKASEAPTKPHFITADEIRAELQRILASGIFATADRMKRFLRFVVEETLAGRAMILTNRASASKSMIATRRSIREWTPLCVWTPAACAPS